MLKLISLNMEGEKHVSLILPFLAEEQADVICLMEAPQLFQYYLNKLGYETIFSPNLIRERESVTHTEGIIFASRHPFESEVEYYYGSPEKVAVYQGEERNVSNLVISGQVTIGNDIFSIATTHMTVTKHGLADEHQIQCIDALLSILEQKEPHVICGDFNMPRGHNDQYEKFTQKYIDEIPAEYTSSLDRDIHRLGSDPNLTDPIFDSFMVDYIFTQPPFSATAVRLKFGVSDHAAVISTIEKQT